MRGSCTCALDMKARSALAAAKRTLASASRGSTRPGDAPYGDAPYGGDPRGNDPQGHDHSPDVTSADLPVREAASDRHNIRRPRRGHRSARPFGAGIDGTEHRRSPRRERPPGHCSTGRP